jgi:hypothetical protein
VKQKIGVQSGLLGVGLMALYAIGVGLIGVGLGFLPGAFASPLVKANGYLGVAPFTPVQYSPHASPPSASPPSFSPPPVRSRPLPMSVPKVPPISRKKVEKAKKAKDTAYPRVYIDSLFFENYGPNDVVGRFADGSPITWQQILDIFGPNPDLISTTKGFIPVPGGAPTGSPPTSSSSNSSPGSGSNTGGSNPGGSKPGGNKGGGPFTGNLGGGFQGGPRVGGGPGGGGGGGNSSPPPPAPPVAVVPGAGPGAAPPPAAPPVAVVPGAGPPPGGSPPPITGMVIPGGPAPAIPQVPGGGPAVPGVAIPTQSVSSTPSSGGTVQIPGSGVPAGFELVESTPVGPELDDLELLVDLEGNFIGGPAAAKEWNKLLDDDEKARLKKIIAERRPDYQAEAFYHEEVAKQFGEGEAFLTGVNIVSTAVSLGTLGAAAGAYAAGGTLLVSGEAITIPVAAADILVTESIGEAGGKATSWWFF